MTNQFYETRTMFENFTGCTANERLPYDVWMTFHRPNKDGKDPNSKAAAALFVMFFDQITLAWSKARADFVPDEDAIECVLQYLQKNVDIIRANKSRYTANYIYRVAYNCMDCLRYIERDKFRSKLETSHMVDTDDDTVDLYDLQPEEIDFDLEAVKADMWRLLENEDEKTIKVINHLLNGESLARVSSRSAAYKNDPLKDIGVTKAECEEIIRSLRTKLAKYKALILGDESELRPATEEDLVPLSLRKQPKICDQVYDYLKSNGIIDLFEAERLFLLTRMPLHRVMQQLKDKGYPVVAHYEKVGDKVVAHRTTDMIDYYYIEA